MPETQDFETDEFHGYSFYFFPNKAQKYYKKNTVIFSVYKHCQIELITWTMQSIIPACFLIKTHSRLTVPTFYKENGSIQFREMFFSENPFHLQFLTQLLLCIRMAQK